MNHIPHIQDEIDEYLPLESQTYHKLQDTYLEFGELLPMHLWQPSQENPKDHSYAAETHAPNGCPTCVEQVCPLIWEEVSFLLLVDPNQYPNGSDSYPFSMISEEDLNYWR